MGAVNPTKGQQEALDKIQSLVDNPANWRVLVVSGAAGTGKTSLLKFLGEQYAGTFVLTPTGKAAVRVKEATGLDAMTIHKWLYFPAEDEKTGEVSFGRQGRDTIRMPPVPVLFVDEASMITEAVWHDLHDMALLLGLNVVLIGDGHQLPPVETDKDRVGFSVFSPDFYKGFVERVELTEVLRQALESPIIRTATAIRKGGSLEELLGEWANHGEALDDQALATWGEKGAVIVGTNRTRQELNLRMRQLLGRPGDRVETGEPLLVLKNSYEADVFNGEVFEIGSYEPREETACFDRYQKLGLYVRFDEVMTTAGHHFMAAHQQIFNQLPEKFNSKALMQGSKRASYPEMVPFVEANLGYALTAHKSQGSEWGSALVVLEKNLRLRGADENSRRWCYTAITRAKKTLRVHAL
jgi:exodeoxyribonuclease-5